MPTEAAGALDAPAIDRSEPGRPGQAGAMPLAGVREVGVSELAAARVEHGRGERPAVRVDADDVDCRHVVASRSWPWWEGPRDDIPVEVIDALIRSARSSGDRAGVDTSSGGQPPGRGGAGDLLRVRPRHGHPPYEPPSWRVRHRPVQHWDLLVDPLQRVGAADLRRWLREGEVDEQVGLGRRRAWRRPPGSAAASRRRPRRAGPAPGGLVGLLEDRADERVATMPRRRRGTRARALRRKWTLCRRRHKVQYADPRLCRYRGERPLRERSGCVVGIILALREALPSHRRRRAPCTIHSGSASAARLLRTPPATPPISPVSVTGPRARPSSSGWWREPECLARCRRARSESPLSGRGRPLPRRSPGCRTHAVRIGPGDPAGARVPARSWASFPRSRSLCRIAARSAPRPVPPIPPRRAEPGIRHGVGLPCRGPAVPEQPCHARWARPRSADGRGCHRIRRCPLPAIRRAAQPS